MLSIGDVRCALPAQEVARVVPRATLHPVAGLPDYVVGRLSYQGLAVPVLDLCQLVLGRPCSSVYSTRIVLVDYPLQDGTVPLGLLAERVTEATRRDPCEFRPSSLRQGGFLAEVATEQGQLINALRVKGLLSPELHDQLFRGEGS